MPFASSFHNLLPQNRQPGSRRNAVLNSELDDLSFGSEPGRQEMVMRSEEKHPVGYHARQHHEQKPTETNEPDDAKFRHYGGLDELWKHVLKNPHHPQEEILGVYRVVVERVEHLPEHCHTLKGGSKHKDKAGAEHWVKSIHVVDKEEEPPHKIVSQSQQTYEIHGPDPHGPFRQAKVVPHIKHDGALWFGISWTVDHSRKASDQHPTAHEKGVGHDQSGHHTNQPHHDEHKPKDKPVHEGAHHAPKPTHPVHRHWHRGHH